MTSLKSCSLLLLLSVCVSSLPSQAPRADDLFPLSIIHINDFHARFEETDTSGSTCKDPNACVGGYARTVYTIKKLLQDLKDTNPIYINAGDSFQGTLWYNIGRWNVTSQFLNMLPADVMTLGNHEFDHGIDGVVPFLETIDTEMLVANMDSTKEPKMTGKYKNSTIIEKGGRKIGVIGVILETVDNLASTGLLVFRNESDTIVEEAQLLKAQGANIIIVVSHCGYDVDQLIAKNAGHEIDVIVGSHSHTFLWTGTDYPGPEKSCDTCNYPTEVIHANGHRVLIVQASAYARYVGNLTVYFDNNGDVVDYEGAPIYMGNKVPQDQDVITAMQPWKEIVDERGNVVVAENKVTLLKSTCGYEECNLGNFFTDALIHSSLKTNQPLNPENWANVSIALINTGALRVPIDKGNITYGTMVTMSPFENVLSSVEIPGSVLKSALELSVQSIDLDKGVTSSSIFLQVSGLQIEYNYRNPVGSRVVNLLVRCAECPYPMYEEFDINKSYRIVGPNFLIDGGDGFYMFPEHGKYRVNGEIDIDALVGYAQDINPITTGTEGRIKVIK